MGLNITGTQVETAVKSAVDILISQAEEQANSTEFQTRKLVDEFGDLMAWDTEFKKTNATRIARLAELKKLMSDLAPPTADDDQKDIVVEGDRYDLVLGAKSKNREIADMAGVMKKVTRDVFLELCTFPLGKLDELLTKPQRDKVLKETREARSFKVRERPAAAK